MNKTLLKQIFVFLLSLTLIFSFASCGVIDSIFGGDSNVSQNLNDDDDDDDDEDDNEDKKKDKDKGKDENVKAITDEQLITALDRSLIAATMIEHEGITTDPSIADSTKTVVSNDIETITEGYANYLENELCVSFMHEYGDFDKNDATEVFFIINGFNYEWAGRLSYLDEGFRFESNAFNGNDLLVLYLYTAEEATIVEAFCTMDVTVTENVRATYGDGIFNIFPNGSTTHREQYILSANDAGAAAVKYKSYLATAGNTDIKYFEADLCDSEGNEYVFVYKNGRNTNIRLTTFINGKLYDFYTLSEEVTGEKAVYVAQKDSVCYVVEYTNDYDYFEYRAYRFDTSYMLIENSASDSSDSDFYTKLNGFLASAIACSNIYSNTSNTIDNGFASMTIIGDLEFKNSAMLSTGAIEVSSWLHLREGPSVSYPGIATSYWDDDSLIQLKTGMEVEIQDYVNTTDSENPIWLKVSVLYQGVRYEGYCSKTYVKTPGVASMHPGKTYDLNTTADDTLLKWNTSDTSIATVDANGVVTGHKKGVAVITASADTGIEITCHVVVC